MKPEFLDFCSILDIHALHLHCTGGLAGLRDEGLLKSALAQPEATFGGEFLHEDLYAMAASYLFHIVKNHPFLDGNKRVGLAAAITFLDVNGIHLDRELTELYELTMSVAEGHLNKVAVAEAFRRLSVLPSESDPPTSAAP